MTSCHNISPFAVTINEKQDKTADKYVAQTDKMKYNTFAKTDKTIFSRGASGMENSSNSTLQRTAAKKIQFFLQSNTRKALLVTGARQVGKTTLIRQLGQEAFPNFVELNFLENTAAPL